MFDFRLNQQQNEPEEEGGGDYDAAALFSALLRMAIQQRQRQGQQQNQGPNDYFAQMLKNQGGGQNQAQFGPQVQQQSSFPGENPLMAALRQRESGGNYGIQNSLGYQGAYQMGAPALEDVGYLRKGAGRLGNKGLNDPRNWTIEGGKQAYLASRELQDNAMQKLMDHNKQAMERMGLIKPDTSPNMVNALLAAAHIGGPGGAKALLNGKNRRDAYGTGVKEYFNLGMNAS